MAIKVGNVEVISNSGDGRFSVTRVKSYTNEELVDKLVVGTKVNDFVLNKGTGKFAFWDGENWTNTISVNYALTQGAQTYTDGEYVYEVFPKAGSLTISKSMVFDILAVGGGGGGGLSAPGNSSGGGGAGAVISQVNTVLQAGVYNITVGEGGSATVNGGDSSIVFAANSSDFSLVSAGGGAGSPTFSVDGNPGGSGGGGGGYNRAGGLALDPKYGNPGGPAYASGNSGLSGGGGGAGSKGKTSSAGSGSGGDGVTYEWLDGLPTSIGAFGPAPGRWFGGGGGGGFYTGTPSSGGAGGGGKGWPWNPAVNAAQTNGQPGTGAGGGGGRPGQSDYGGKGGDGIVVFRYRLDTPFELTPVNITTNGHSATWTDTDGNKVAIWINPGYFTMDAGESQTVTFSSVLIGGGGGGGTYGGGGGAGGVLYQENKTINVNGATQRFNVDIGDGGGNETKGKDSTVTNDFTKEVIFRALGGGRGGGQYSYNNTNERNGGSGGGASWPDGYSCFGGHAEVGQGFKGGDTAATGGYRTSGGGGATSAGENAAPNKSGNGGRGIVIDWGIPGAYGTPAPGGVGRAFAGGGGGGGSPQYGHPAGTGGLGGGGNGGYGAPGPSANPQGYGSGGGGGGNAPGISYAGGSGRKGVFILKWKP